MFIGHLKLDTSTRQFLEEGGAAILLGCTREEYLACAMSVERIANETAADFQVLVEDARSVAGRILVAVDQEVPGLQRLHQLAPSTPEINRLHAMPTGEIEDLCKRVGLSANALGVNLFLAPVVDVVAGPDPWLGGRTLGTNVDEVSRITSAYIRGVQAGGVAATAKHFPGHPTIPGDPAISDVSVRATLPELEKGWPPFRSAIESGVSAIMIGPMVIEAIDANNAASISPRVIEILRSQLGFKGLVISDDLDSKATLGPNNLMETAVRSLAAGAELLLFAAGPHISEVADAIVAAVKSGRVQAAQLAAAAQKVRALAAELTPKETGVRKARIVGG